MAAAATMADETDDLSLDEPEGTPAAAGDITLDESPKPAKPPAKLSLEQKLKALPGARRYVFHLYRDAFANSLGLDFDSLDPSGYYMVKRGRDVVLAGRTGRGNAYALADFLKRFAGYRYFGTPYGTIEPHTDDLVLPLEGFTFREEPDVPSVYVAGRGALGNFGRDFRITCQATHAMSDMVKPSMWDEHPEYFPLVGGKRRPPQGPWNPCMSNPDLPQLFDAYADEYFRKNPDKVGLPLGVNDGGGDCQCPSCEELWKKHGNQYAVFYNMAARRLAKSHPGKYLAFIAYSTRCSGVPRGLKMEPNIFLEKTAMSDVGKSLQAWRDAGVRNFGVYEYLYAFNADVIAPAYYPHGVADHFRSLYREFGMKSLWQEYFDWSPIIDAGRQYIVDELMWNMDADVDALLDDYFKSLYGPAEKQVRRFHDLAEAAFARRKAKPDWTAFFSDWHNPLQFQGYSFDDLAAMDAALAEAVEAAKGDETVARRVRLLAKLWSFQKAMIENWICSDELRRTDDPDAIAALVKRALAAIAVTKAFSLDPDDAAWIRSNPGDGPFKGVHSQQLAPQPLLELAADDACARATAKLGKEAARAAWTRLAADQDFAPFAGTQLYLMDHETVNLARNASFEKLGAGAKPLPGSTNFFPLSLAGWGMYAYPNTTPRVVVDSAMAHTGTNSVCIMRNQIDVALLSLLGGTSGDRYRVSAWVRLRTGTKTAGGRFYIRFKDGFGHWLDNGSAIEAKVPQAALEDWAKVSCSFTAPPARGDKVTILAGFAAPANQGENDRIWWDDIVVEKIWEVSRGEAAR